MPFEAILDDARRARAVELAMSDEHALIEIAFLVGYSDPSHFTRAFRRWTGVTPRAFKRQSVYSSDRGGSTSGSQKMPEQDRRLLPAD
jgi:AraC-like DNA-binding protein